MGHSTDKRQQAIKARFIMVSLQTKRYYLYTKNAVIRGPVIRGRPRLWARSMTARFLFRFGMLRTFKHKTRGHRPRPQSSGALCALVSQGAINSHLLRTAPAVRTVDLVYA